MDSLLEPAGLDRGTVLSVLGRAETAAQLQAQGIDPEAARARVAAMTDLAAARRHGCISYLLAPGYGDLLREVASGTPVVVLQEIGYLPLVPTWHCAVVNGFDYPSGTVWLRSGTEPRRAMPFTAFERSWMKGGYWAMVASTPERIPVTATERRWLAAVLAFARTQQGEPLTRAYAAALQRWPDSLPAAVGLANQHHARGAIAESIAVLREARRRHPQSVVLANNLAQALSDRGRQREALALTERATDPANPFAAEVRATRS